MSAIVLHEPTSMTAWALVLDGNEPRVRDITLGERLGYGRPRDVRKLVGRLIEAGDLSDVLARSTVARIENRGNLPSTTTVVEYWLTIEQALFVAARSETPIGTAILKEMIAVFLDARRGPDVRAELAAMNERLARLEATVAPKKRGRIPPHNVVFDARAKEDAIAFIETVEDQRIASDDLYSRYVAQAGKRCVSRSTFNRCVTRSGRFIRGRTGYERMYVKR